MTLSYVLTFLITACTVMCVCVWARRISRMPLQSQQTTEPNTTNSCGTENSSVRGWNRKQPSRRRRLFPRSSNLPPVIEGIIRARTQISSSRQTNESSGGRKRENEACRRKVEGNNKKRSLILLPWQRHQGIFVATHA
jgi:hypothetical protein